LIFLIESSQKETYFLNIFLRAGGDPQLRRVMEPRTSTPQARLAAIEELSKAGITIGSFSLSKNSFRKPKAQLEFDLDSDSGSTE